MRTVEPPADDVNVSHHVDCFKSHYIEDETEESGHGDRGNHVTGRGLKEVKMKLYEIDQAIENLIDQETEKY